ncbi:MAG: hypothetical protein Q4A83_04515 [Bacillota bacterium]|nr:hypothetical protein [Bacillota bacterium]
MSKKEKKERRTMSYGTKWKITLVLLLLAAILVVVCVSEGMFSFKSGGVITPNDNDPVVSTDAIDKGGNSEPDADEYTVFISEGNGGTANPSGRVSVDAWGSITVSFTPNDGYEIQSVVVDGNDMGALNSYTLSYITSNHTIMVTFDKIPEPTPEPTPDIPDVEPED